MNKALIERTLAAMDKGYEASAYLEYTSVIEALKAELEKSEPFAPDWADYRQGKDDALAEFSQEPVAWMNMSDEILPTFHRTKEAAAYWGDNPIPLYTKG